MDYDFYNNLTIETKYINDSLYGSISLSKFAIEIIDTEEFQRLRYLKQLGTCYLIYPNAIHTRFEHSLGTYNLCKELSLKLFTNTKIDEMDKYLKEIKELKTYFKNIYSNNYYKFDTFIRELINISALCHDLGHGPFSHIFDEYFLENSFLKNHPNSSHEVRSCLILEKIIKKSELLNKIITNDLLNFMKNIINPSKENLGFIYQIVSNNFNSLDVDKFDYITRDTYSLGIKSEFDYRRLINHCKILNNTICYSDKCSFDIYALFHTRHRMHKQVYSHKGVISTQIMISEIINSLADYINISQCLDNLDLFCKLTDNFIIELPKILNFTSEDNTNLNINKSYKLIQKIESHKLYSTIGYFISKIKFNIDKDTLFLNSEIDLDLIEIYQVKIGFVSGNKPNPFDNIYLYNSNEKDKFKINNNNLTFLISDVYQEYIFIVFYKNFDIIEKNKNLPVLKKQFKKYFNENFPSIDI